LAQPTLSAFEGMLDPSLVVGPYDKAQSTLNNIFSQLSWVFIGEDFDRSDSRN
jgi:hypothetical protein